MCSLSNHLTITSGSSTGYLSLVSQVKEVLFPPFFLFPLFISYFFSYGEKRSTECTPLPSYYKTNTSPTVWTVITN